MVGRIAFWTDDESCKVNINTAAGDEWKSDQSRAGSYWDAPRTNTTFDRQALANYQPAQGEYQRYPGHPATTYLSAVFPSLTSAQIGTIASRVQLGGSQGGTSLSTDKVTPDADRLYASVDELIFDPDRKDQPITKERLELARFFLTANSRAPEANLFNKPRVAIWPIPKTDSAAARSPYDRLIAFCSTISPDVNDPAKKYAYYFDRSNADSATADYSGRNVEVYKYLQGLMNRPIPGFGPSSSTDKNTFVEKYGRPIATRSFTEIMDYIRSTNLYDDTVAAGQQFTDLRTSETGVNKGHGQVTPLKITTTAAATMGFGRFYTLSEAALHFICTADADSTNNADKDARLSSNVAANKTLGGTLLTETATNADRKIETILLLELFSPSQGWTGIRPDMQIRITGLEKLTVNGKNLGFPGDGTLQMTQSATSSYHGRAWGGSAGFRYPLCSDMAPLMEKEAGPWMSEAPCRATMASTTTGNIRSSASRSPSRSRRPGAKR